MVFFGVAFVFVVVVCGEPTKKRIVETWTIITIWDSQNQIESIAIER